MKLLLSCILMFLLSGVAHSSGFIPVIAGNTSSPTSLFQFQVDGTTFINPSNNGLEQGPMPKDYESVIDASYQISSSVAWQNGMMDDNNLASSYLDGPLGSNPSKPGGLGVCKRLSGMDCANSGDDSIQVGESILLNINKPIFVDDIYFTNGAHNDEFNPLAGVNIYIDGVKQVGDLGNGAFRLAPVVTLLADQIINNSIKFEYAYYDIVLCLPDTPCADPNLRSFYVDGFGRPVPIPAAAWLFGSALLGLVGYSRRRAGS